MDMHLTGKVAVVTGASKGIGLAVVQSLAAEGVQVIAGARQTSEALSQLSAAAHVQFVAADLSTSEGPQHLIEAAVTAYGGIDILVNNVGAVHPHLGGFTSITDDEWSMALNLNFLAAVRTTRATLPHLLAREGGVVVTISSVNAFLPDPAIMDYTAAKAALSNWMKALSKEVGPRGIRVNTVSPGPVATDLWLGQEGVAATFGHANGSTPADVAHQVAQTTVTGRFTQPNEIADVVLYLCSDRAGNMMGADVVIDGGIITTWR